MKDTPRLISISDAASRLGYADGRTLRRLAASGRIPGAVKVGAYWTLSLSWLEEQEKSGRPKRGWPRGAGTRKK